MQLHPRPTKKPSDAEVGFISDAVDSFGVSRQTISRHLSRMVADGYLIAEGSTHARKYRLGPVRAHFAEYDLEAIEEHVVYERDFAFIFDGLPPYVKDICDYGFTEMVNNAIDHSEGAQVLIMVFRDRDQIAIGIDDDGEGIFKRIARFLELGDPRESLLELSKGRLTTDPDNHTGEGIFFTSQAYDYFAITSGDLVFTHHDDSPHQDVLFHRDVDQAGTQIDMVIALDTTRTIRQRDEVARSGQPCTLARRLPCSLQVA